MTDDRMRERPRDQPTAGTEPVLPPAHNPTRRPGVWEWAAGRARADWQMAAAGGSAE